MKNECDVSNRQRKSANNVCDMSTARETGVRAEVHPGVRSTTLSELNPSISNILAREPAPATPGP
eukprot:10050123-Alexandrium_andersonii.AAC.1